jgi:D-alanyl-D-alanine carboxypeptidase
MTLVYGLSLLSVSPADAGKRRVRMRGHHARVVLPQGRTDPSKDAALIMDGISGRVLYARNATDLRHPASLTKMMTLYLLFDALKGGQIGMDTTLTFSAHAAAQKPTNMRVRAGDTMTVETAIDALIVRSANDVAVAVAEALGGTEPHFAEMMTAKAHALGMRSTLYRNASGLPDTDQITTAVDLGILARHLAYDYPQYFRYFSEREFVYRGVHYGGHDNLLGRYDGADGIKTGYTGASGFNLVSSVTRGNTHVIGVVMGGYTAQRRDNEMVSLLDSAFGDISKTPTLVAHAQLPWRAAQTVQVAQASQKGIWRVDRDGKMTPLTRGQYAPYSTVRINGVSDSEDEDAAESRGDADWAAMPKPAPKQPATAVAAYQPQHNVVPIPRRIVRPDVTEAPASASGMHDWTIQIGAYADLGQAREQLAVYAAKSMDVLGQAQKIVVPYQAVDGRWLYRARFGPFLEREAKQICSKLSTRGQTCYAAVATR